MEQSLFIRQTNPLVHQEINFHLSQSTVIAGSIMGNITALWSHDIIVKIMSLHNLFL